MKKNIELLMKKYKISKATLAKELNCTRQTIYNILDNPEKLEREYYYIVQKIMGLVEKREKKEVEKINYQRVRK